MSCQPIDPMPERVPAFREAEMVRMEYDGKVFGVDPEIAPLVRALNDAGIRTRASCSGHGFRPGRITLADGRELFVMPNYEVATWFETHFPRDINGQEMGLAAHWICSQCTAVNYIKSDTCRCGLPRETSDRELRERAP